MFPHPEGYVEPVYDSSKSVKGFSTSSQTATNSGYQYAFQYKDHLGNVRLTYADSDLDGAIKTSTEIISEKNYYVFGLQQKGYNNTVTSNKNSMAERFAFGGKEYGQELGLDWYDIQARNYDPAIGRWMNIDPLAEQMRRHSPYNYAFDNPIYFIDPDGMMPQGCCPNPFQGLGEGIARSIRSAGSKITKGVSDFFSGIGSKISSLLPDSDWDGGGGFSFVGDGGSASGPQDLIREGSTYPEKVNVEGIIQAASFAKVGKNSKRGDGRTNVSKKNLKPNVADKIKSGMDDANAQVDKVEAGLKAIDILGSGGGNGPPSALEDTNNTFSSERSAGAVDSDTVTKLVIGYQNGQEVISNKSYPANGSKNTTTDSIMISSQSWVPVDSLVIKNAYPNQN